ncbi:sugar-binding domain-containing protein [Kineococcus sp. TBRC 1896]|uniref:beta-galactosidase n=1 Tax=Kineococcus mangrovi TaxID=1660183 RepID=A0ABV4HYV6_9ACTN
MSLAGRWTVALDPTGVGERELWFTRAGAAASTRQDVTLPGSLQEQGIGDPVGPDTEWTGLVVDKSFYTDDRYAPYRTAENYKVPFWLQPHTYYRGAAWFQRSITVPQEWAGRRVVLSLERVHWESTVWVDDVRVGSDRSLSSAHEFDLGRLSAGEHRLTLRVDNRTVVDVGPNAHSISDHTQSNWNGVIGDLTLRALPDVAIRQVRVRPDLATSSAHVSVDIAATVEGAGRGTVTVSATRRDVPGQPVVAPVVAPVSAHYDAEHGEGLQGRGMTAGGSHVDLTLPLGDAVATWDEFHPALYDVSVELTAQVEGRTHHDVRRTTFGMREVTVEGTQIAVNGRRTFIRGTLESCVFPLTGYPPTDVTAWRRIIHVARAHGLNLLRFHSWCPPEAAFAAADEEGFYLQVEAPVWANQGAAVGEGRPVDRYVYEETQRILDSYGNHPSFVLMAHGNEPAGRDAEFLGQWVEHWRRRDPRRLYTSAAGWPAITENDFDNIPGPRTYAWGEELDARLNARPPETTTDYADWVERTPRPIVSHEVGEWCVYPNFAETGKYTGLLQAKNFEVFADFLEASGMSDQAEEFLHASGRLQFLSYKEEVESALRTPGFGGFQLLGLTDFPGQGTALVGVLDPFWDEKPYSTAAEFARFCGPTVPLARLPRRIFSAGDTLTFEAQVAHFGAAPLDAEVTWRLENTSGAVLADGVVVEGVVPIGNTERLGQVEVPLTGARTEHLKLVLAVRSGDGRSWENDWDLWSYATPTTPEPVGVVETTDVEEALRRAGAGETVLLAADPKQVAGDVGLGFSTVFWNTAWTRNQAPHTLGITHDPSHPLFDGFPSDGHTDWQWWELLHDAGAMVLDGLPTTLRPLVQPIDTWFSARRLGTLFEARVGRGRLVVCTMDVRSDLDDRPVARQFRDGLLRYVSGEHFAPGTTIDPDDVRRLFVTT